MAAREVHWAGEDPHKCHARQAKVQVLTYANKRSPDSKFCRFLTSAIQNRLDLKLLNWAGEHQANGMKLIATEKEVADYDPCTWVVFTDAYDVMFAGGKDEIRKSLEYMYGVAPHPDKGHWTEKPVPSHHALFSAECGCFPVLGWSNGKHRCEVEYPQSPTMYRYLNSGTWAARSWVAHRFLSYLLNKNGDKSAKLDDQAMSSEMFLNRPDRGNITLDYQAELFMTFHESGSCFSRRVMEVDASTGRWHNKDTDTHPLVLHYNGSPVTKDYLIDMEYGMWYFHGPKTEEAKKLHPKPLTLDEVTATTLRTGPTSKRPTDGEVVYSDTQCGPASKSADWGRFVNVWKQWPDGSRPASWHP